MMTDAKIQSDDVPLTPTAIWLIPAVMLAIALAPLPYGYFMLLRLVVCGAAVWLSYALISGGRWQGMGWTFVAIAILYNPVFKVHFERELWMILNLITIAPFALFGWKARPRTH
jgi:hypothetical protein